MRARTGNRRRRPVRMPLPACIYSCRESRLEAPPGNGQRLPRRERRTAWPVEITLCLHLSLYLYLHLHLHLYLHLCLSLLLFFPTRCRLFQLLRR